MSDDLCPHDLDPATCSMCKSPRMERVSQLTLPFTAIEEAVTELAAAGEFRTKDVAEHPAVRSARSSITDDPRTQQDSTAATREALRQTL